MGCSEAVVGRAEQALEQQAQALDDELPAQARCGQAAVTRGAVQVGVRRERAQGCAGLAREELPCRLAQEGVDPVQVTEEDVADSGA